ncbi:MAG: transposase [Ruminococcus sp.]|nr:transposase [Ruminococcus sp.]
MQVVYRAVEPKNDDSFFLIIPYCNTDCMNLFLQELSKEFADDMIVLAYDGARWHKSESIQISGNIVMFFILPYTPEMNSIEQIWDEIREKGFRNECFSTLAKVMDRLCDTINNLSKKCISSITGREWILSIGV